MIKRLEFQANDFEQAMSIAQGIISILNFDDDKYTFIINPLPIGKLYELSVYTKEGSS